MERSLIGVGIGTCIGVVLGYLALRREAKEEIKNIGEKIASKVKNIAHKHKEVKHAHKVIPVAPIPPIKRELHSHIIKKIKKRKKRIEFKNGEVIIHHGKGVTVGSDWRWIFKEGKKVAESPLAWYYKVHGIIYRVSKKEPWMYSSCSDVFYGILKDKLKAMGYTIIGFGSAFWGSKRIDFFKLRKGNRVYYAVFNKGSRIFYGIVNHLWEAWRYVR